MPDGGHTAPAHMVCAWKGCTRCYPITGEQPPGWRFLATYRAPPPRFVESRFVPNRDAAICPRHALVLDACLKEV